jgi:WD repeat-containing protein 26
MERVNSDFYRLMVCSSTEELKQQANWDGAEGSSRQQLLSELSGELS